MAGSRSFASSSLLSFLSLAFILFSTFVHSRPAARSGTVRSDNICRNEAFDPFDYSVKPKPDLSLPICPVPGTSAAVDTRDLLFGRQVTQQDDYSCSESRPCRNGACCAKTGWCNYGPEACGTSGVSPNEVCWSNCDAKAECGRYASSPDKECPLNVCCSPFGFCGMTEEFCTITDDEETSCQSNCEQPESGASGSNVRERVIGYYEAWVHSRKCNGMSIDQIPVGALTHLMFSFGYVTPGNFDIVPMDDLDPELFTKMTALKRRNKALKVMIALGGWTFNDPGPTQKVFSDMASTPANRAKFIANLLSFMRQYAFDGVDFDWEYPGAEDRGGIPEDAENFTKLLQELRTAIRAQPIEYQVSFTTPTSYWYLRHFDIKDSTDAVDFVNIMSYDLHGVWDAWNPIGNNVLAHTNITEIKLALDLYWRNDIPPEKLNLGIGFYGRSFELSDPSCSTPGCQFKGGAAPGPCTANSGTLAYREIVDIIEANHLEPYYDEEHQVKYITWNQNQWVSYDDEETIKAKIDFANDHGLGGLLIWSVDQDTDDLKALEAVVGKETIALAMKNKQGDDAAFWKDIGDQACYVTDCGGNCKTGFKTVTTQPCGGAKFLTRHSTEADSKLCCPLTSSPDPADCTWRGEAPSCNGRCHDGEAMLQMNRWGSGKYCEDGNKAYCCAVPQGKNTDCYWSGMGNTCRNGDKPLTFAGTFLSDIADFAQFFGLVGDLLSDALDDLDMELKELYCCPAADLERWQNCDWHGKPGSCFDNHCDSNTQVQLATSRYGGGQSCSPRLERSRVLCCDPPDGETLFLPVPLENLFPNPPEGDDVDTDFDLKVDNTWGDGDADTDTDEDPDAASFQFYVLASPDEIQISLDKRDGSHWELFNCNDADSEEEQTIQMICTDESETSNCNDIHKGAGAPGTILQMPRGQGCGPGKYAVAKSLEVSQNQTLPHHIAKRRAGHHRHTIYDLTFDYDFARVPRDFGETQFRVDYSNQEGYWDNVVAKPAGKKIKRSLSDVGGNHRRWLEEEWRDDYHHGALTREELHKRWFGSDVISWLQGLLNIDIKKEKRHDYEEDVSVIILQEHWECKPRPELTFSASIDAVATASIKMSTSYGFTLITTLGPGMDLSQSYLHFNNEGAIEAIFTLEAIAKVDWDSDIFNIATIPMPGAGFRIPGIMTVGPAFDINGRFKAGVAVEGKVEARVTLADWEIRQTYPEQNDDFDPEAVESPKRDFGVNGLSEPSFEASVQASGYAEAHLLPTLSFGIAFDSRWGIGKANVELLADGWARMRVKSDLVGGDCAFAYAVDAGAGLIARANVPDKFNWQPAPLTLGSIDGTLIPSNGDEWRCLTGGGNKRAIDSMFFEENNINSTMPSSSLFNKRLVPYGPMISLPKSEQLCPNKGAPVDPGACISIFAADEMYGDGNELQARDIAVRDPNTHLQVLDSRLSKGPLNVCVGNGVMTVTYPDYPEGNVIYDNADWADCDNYDFGVQGAEQSVPKPNGQGNERYIAEHVLEAHLLQGFMRQYARAGDTNSICSKMSTQGWKDYVTIGGRRMQPWDYIGEAYPSYTSNPAEMNRIIESVNIIKENAFKNNNIPGNARMRGFCSSEDQVDRAIRSMKSVIMTIKYLKEPAIRTILVNQANRVADRFDTVEDAVVGLNKGYAKNDFKTKWKSFIKGRTEEAISRLDKFLDDWIEPIEKVLENTDPRQDAATPGRAKRRTKIEKLREAVDDVKGTLTNPL